MSIIPMRDLKNTVEVERRCAEENGPVYITKNGYGRLVVMDIEYYERTMQKMYEAKAVLDGLAVHRSMMDFWLPVSRPAPICCSKILVISSDFIAIGFSPSS